jgi:hypothetical protein
MLFGDRAERVEHDAPKLRRVLTGLFSQDDIHMVASSPLPGSCISTLARG